MSKATACDASFPYGSIGFACSTFNPKLSPNIPEKEVEDGPRAYVLVPMWENRVKLLYPGFSLVQSQASGHLGSESVNGTFLPLSV